MPEVSQYYKQQKLTSLSGVGNLTAADISAATQGNRELARAGEMATEFGLQFIQQKEKAEYHSQFNTAKTEDKVAFANFKQSLIGTDPETWESQFESFQSGLSSRERVLTNNRASTDHGPWLENFKADAKIWVLNQKHTEDVRLFVRNQKLNVDASTDLIANAETDTDLMAELLDSMSNFGQEPETTTDADGNEVPKLDENGHPVPKDIEGDIDTVYDSQENKVFAYNAMVKKGLARREKNIQKQAKEAVTGSFQAVVDEGLVIDENGKVVSKDNIRRDAYDVIDKAYSDGMITATMKGTLRNNVDTYISQGRKKAADTAKASTTEIYDDFIKDAVAGEFDYENIEPSKLSAKDKLKWQDYARGSYEDAPVAGKIKDERKGEAALYEAVYKGTIKTASKLEAKEKLLETRYIDKTITDEQFRWGLDRIENPYPRFVMEDLMTTLDENEMDFNRFWSRDTDRNKKVNDALVSWVDDQIAQGKNPTKKEMMGVSSQFRVEGGTLLDVGQIIERGGIKYEVVGFFPDGEPDVEAVD